MPFEAPVPSEVPEKQKKVNKKKGRNQLFDAQIGITLIKNYITKIIDFMINQLTLISLKKYIYLIWMGIYIFQNTTVEGGGWLLGEKIKTD